MLAPRHHKIWWGVWRRWNRIIARPNARRNLIKDFHRNPAPQSRKLIEHVQPSHMAVDLEGVEGIVIQNQALEVCIIAQARKNLNLTKHQLTMQGNVALQNVSVSVGQGQVALRPDKSTAMAAQLRFQLCQEPFGSSLASGNMGMQGCCSKIENPKVFQIRLALRTQRPTTLDIPENFHHRKVLIFGRDQGQAALTTRIGCPNFSVKHRSALQKFPWHRAKRSTNHLQVSWMKWFDRRISYISLHGSINGGDEMRYANSNHTAPPCINFQPKKWKDMINTSCSCQVEGDGSWSNSHRWRRPMHYRIIWLMRTTCARKQRNLLKQFKILENWLRQQLLHAQRPHLCPNFGRKFGFHHLQSTPAGAPYRSSLEKQRHVLKKMDSRTNGRKLGGPVEL